MVVSSKDNLKAENIEAITEGCKNLEKHIKNISQFGVPVVVGINEYVTDTKEEHQAIIDFCKQLNVECKISEAMSPRHYQHGFTWSIQKIQISILCMKMTCLC